MQSGDLCAFASSSCFGGFGFTIAFSRLGSLFAQLDSITRRRCGARVVLLPPHWKDVCALAEHILFLEDVCQAGPKRGGNRSAMCGTESLLGTFPRCWLLFFRLVWLAHPWYVGSLVLLGIRHLHLAGARPLAFGRSKQD